MPTLADGIEVRTQGGGRFQVAKADGRCKWREAKHTDPAPVDRLCSEPIGLETVLALGGGDRRRARRQSEAVESKRPRVDPESARSHHNGVEAPDSLDALPKRFTHSANHVVTPTHLDPQPRRASEKCVL